jgi:hypothetical protein
MGIAWDNVRKNVPHALDQGERRIELRPLLWGAGEEASIASPPLDFILAADLLYNSERCVPLLKRPARVS